MAESQHGGAQSTAQVLTVAVLVSLVCSVLVATAAVLLKPRQQINERLNMQRNILQVAGLLESGAEIADLFQRVEARLVELASGAFVAEPDASGFDEVSAAKDPELSIRIPDELDVARLGRRARFGTVYLVRADGELESIILPVRGAGLWSALNGFIALDPDGTTIRGISFYEHGETPGLGDQIDDPQWRASWQGKQAFDAAGAVRVAVIKGRVMPDADAAIYQIDGLAGATLTGNGVTNLVRYWLGDHGYGPFLDRLRAGDTQL